MLAEAVQGSVLPAPVRGLGQGLDSELGGTCTAFTEQWDSLPRRSAFLQVPTPITLGPAAFTKIILEKLEQTQRQQP